MLTAILQYSQAYINIYIWDSGLGWDNKDNKDIIYPRAWGHIVHKVYTSEYFIFLNI